MPARTRLFLGAVSLAAGCASWLLALRPPAFWAGFAAILCSLVTGEIAMHHGADGKARLLAAAGIGISALSAVVCLVVLRRTPWL